MTVSLWSLLAGALTLWAAAMAVVVVLQRRSPAATIAWILLLVLLPIGGWLVYRLIGPLRLERRKARRRATRKVVEEATAALWEIEHSAPTHHRDQLARVAIAAGEAPPLRAIQAPTLAEEDEEEEAEIDDAVELTAVAGEAAADQGGEDDRGRRRRRRRRRHPGAHRGGSCGGARRARTPAVQAERQRRLADR